jgi:hypothetical protein
MSSSAPEPALFLIWSRARAHERRIMADIANHFVIREVVEVTWSADETFAANLNRFYGDVLPPGSDKEADCGTGPFLVVVVEDPRPRYRVRRTSHGPRYLNSNVVDARRRYREWAGGYRVHASDGPQEFRRNMTLLFGGRAGECSGTSWSGDVTTWRSDPVGTHGWTSVEDLLDVLAAYGARPVGEAGESVTVAAPNAWWVGVVAGGHESCPGVRQARVGDREVRLSIFECAADHPRGMAAVVSSRYTQRLYQVAERLRRLTWTYPRPSTSLAVGGVAAVSVGLGRALLPPRWRPGTLVSLTAAVPGTYAVLRMADESGAAKRFKHTLLDRIGGNVDDAQTWLGGVVSALVLLVAVRVVEQRCVALTRRAGRIPGTTTGR